VSKTFDCSDDGERGRGLAEAAAAIRRAELVVVPTDTVYGIAADAFSAAAVNLLLAAKGRGRDMPVPVLVSSRAMLDAVVREVTDDAGKLVDAFWPGALTLVLHETPHLAWDLGEARGTVAVRMPDHPIISALIEQTGPLAVSSANRSGQPPASTTMDARLQLGASVSVYLDGGPGGPAVPSSIVDLTGDTPRLLRAGAVDQDALRAVLPDLASD
jgi:tRNA threonylcarbamoyl adenosine modification protein (Sua5/YciO/YrdC/YwlC family)